MPLWTPLIFFLSKPITLKCQKCYVWHLQFLQSYLSNFFNCNEDRNTHKWPCNPILHCVPSARHCHRQQSQAPAGTELNGCLALFIAGWPRKLKGCLGEGVCTITLTIHLCDMSATLNAHSDVHTRKPFLSQQQKRLFQLQHKPSFSVIHTWQAHSQKGMLQNTEPTRFNWEIMIIQNHWLIIWMHIAVQKIKWGYTWMKI